MELKNGTEKFSIEKSNQEKTVPKKKNNLLEKCLDRADIADELKLGNNNEDIENISEIIKNKLVKYVICNVMVIFVKL